MRVPGLVKRFPDGLNLGRRHSGAKAGSLRSADTRHSQKSSATTISIAKNEGLRRFLIFALLGPPLGMITRMWGILPVLNWSLGDAAVIDYHQIVLMPLAYRGRSSPRAAGCGVRRLARQTANPIPRRLVRAVRLRGELSSAARRAVDGIPARAVRGDFRFAGGGARGCVLMAFRQPGAASPATGGAVVNAQTPTEASRAARAALAECGVHRHADVRCDFHRLRAVRVISYG